jgi:hypothetical protein
MGLKPFQGSSTVSDLLSRPKYGFYQSLGTLVEEYFDDND